VRCVLPPPAIQREASRPGAGPPPHNEPLSCHSHAITSRPGNAVLSDETCRRCSSNNPPSACPAATFRIILFFPRLCRNSPPGTPPPPAEKHRQTPSHRGPVTTHAEGPVMPNCLPSPPQYLKANFLSCLKHHPSRFGGGTAIAVGICPPAVLAADTTVKSPNWLDQPACILCTPLTKKKHW